MSNQFGRPVAFVLLACIVQHSSPVALAEHVAHGDLGAPQVVGHDSAMLFQMVLQQDGQVFDALPRNLLIIFLVLSFMIPIMKYIYRLVRVQVQLFLEAANQDEEEELIE